MKIKNYFKSIKKYLIENMAEHISEAAIPSENEPTNVSAEVSSNGLESVREYSFLDSIFALGEDNDDEHWVHFGVGGPA